MLQLGLVALLASPLPWTAPAPAPAPIYGGELVEPGAWPTAVAILMGDTMCTGTLVSPTVVLTAAHCLDNNPSPALMHVVVGDDVWTNYETFVSVASHGSHPDFCGTDTEVCKVDIWDYGYVVLEEPLVGVEPTRPLSDQAEWDAAMYIGAPITVVGFGDDEKSLNGFKRQVDVEIVRFSPSGLEFQAGGEGHDSCQGDSGGPAFVTLLWRGRARRRHLARLHVRQGWLLRHPLRRAVLAEPRDRCRPAHRRVRGVRLPGDRAEPRRRLRLRCRRRRRWFARSDRADGAGRVQKIWAPTRTYVSALRTSSRRSLIASAS
ncbi:S1 family peptidase [Nannocystis pusilla]|uniref:S1 family peptidase n=1 Tax=Nannocystis pusilla TaxID=889268 RepID=UPI003B778C22